MAHADETLSIPASIPELIGHWKTIREFSADIGCGYEAARKFRDRESIPPEYWESIILASEKKGVSGIDWEWLGRVNARKRA